MSKIERQVSAEFMEDILNKNLLSKGWRVLELKIEAEFKEKFWKDFAKKLWKTISQMHSKILEWAFDKDKMVQEWVSSMNSSSFAPSALNMPKLKPLNLSIANKAKENTENNTNKKNPRVKQKPAPAQQGDSQDEKSDSDASWDASWIKKKSWFWYFIFWWVFTIFTPFFFLPAWDVDKEIKRTTDTVQTDSSGWSDLPTDSKKAAIESVLWTSQ